MPIPAITGRLTVAMSKTLVTSTRLTATEKVENWKIPIGTELVDHLCTVLISRYGMGEGVGMSKTK